MMLTKYMIERRTFSADNDHTYEISISFLSPNSNFPERKCLELMCQLIEKLDDGKEVKLDG